MRQTDAERKREALVQFGFVIGREFPSTEALPNFRAAMIGQELMSVARELAGLNLSACNYGLSKRQETRSANLEKKAQELAAELGTSVVFNGDPRGAALFLVLPSGYCGGDWGKRGYPVPEV